MCGFIRTRILDGVRRGMVCGIPGLKIQTWGTQQRRCQCSQTQNLAGPKAQTKFGDLNENRTPDNCCNSCCTLIALGLPTSAHAKSNKGFSVENAGGTISNTKIGDQLTVTITSDLISIYKYKYVEDNQNILSKETTLLLQFKPVQVTGLSYGSEAHHRIGTGVAVAFLSLGAGAILMCTKSKKHFIGINWDADGVKGGIAVRVDKDEYRGLIASLEGVTGKSVVDTDQTVATKLGVQ